VKKVFSRRKGKVRKGEPLSPEKRKKPKTEINPAKKRHRTGKETLSQQQRGQKSGEQVLWSPGKLGGGGCFSRRGEGNGELLPTREKEKAAALTRRKKKKANARAASRKSET